MIPWLVKTMRSVKRNPWMQTKLALLVAPTLEQSVHSLIPTRVEKDVTDTTNATGRGDTS